VCIETVTAMSAFNEEYWLPVPNIDGYRVSSLGRVMSKRRLRKTYVFPIRNRYPTLQLPGRGTVTVHTLVLEAFVGPKPPGKQCCHYDDMPTDNRLFQLRWDTPAANYRDAKRNGRITEKAVTEILDLRSRGLSYRQIGRQVGMTANGVMHLLRRHGAH
jgi:hypothetical protein